MTGINDMPGDARVWVYQADRLLTDAEVSALAADGKEFIDKWAAHGASLKASFDIKYNLFIVIAADEKQALASGCSIDSSVRFVKSLEPKYNIRLFDRMNVAYRGAGKISIVSLNEFEKLAAENKVGKDTVVFNNMISTKAEYDSKWEVPVSESWQSRVLAQ